MVRNFPVHTAIIRYAILVAVSFSLPCLILHNIPDKTAKLASHGGDRNITGFSAHSKPRIFFV
jgi:hypothetical protein